MANFHLYGDLTEIINKRQYLLHRIHVRYGYPEEWENHRRQLHPIFKLEKSQEQYKGKCSLRKNRLVIDGKEFTTAPRKNLTELSQDLKPRTQAGKQNENVLHFLDSHSAFSNLKISPL